MASSMRNGAQAATGGQLFKDTVFWVAHKLPSRDYILELIKKNGGIVTHLENQADLRIADHTMKKKYVVPDSISYEYITDSVIKGVTQLPDRYLILPPFDQKTQESRKRTRTIFTPAEDAALLIYVESHTKDRTGNHIYKIFAESNPRHTWQSWRNRYVRTLLHYPSHQMERLRSLGTSAPVPAPAPAPAPASVSMPVDSATTPAACLSPHRKSTMSASEKHNPRQPSASHESTPAQSNEHETETEDETDLDQFEQDAVVFEEESGRSVVRKPKLGGKCFHIYKLARAVLAQKVADEQVDWRRVAEDLGYDLEQNQSVANGLKDCYQKNLADWFELLRIFEAQKSERKSSPARSEEDRADSDVDHEDQIDQFYLELESFQDRSDLPVKRESEVGGKCLKFWHLGQAVLIHRESNGEVDWRRVVKDLEARYDWGQDQEVVDELKECFKENLAAWFEEEVYEALEKLQKEQAAQKHEEDEFQSNLDSPERQVYPSSPPVGPSGHKRRLDDDDDDDDDDPIYLPEKSAKRRRLNHTAEIPSTPEQMLGIPSSCTPTGSKFRQQKQEEEDEEEEDEEDEEEEDEEEEEEEEEEELYGHAPPVMSSSDLKPPPGTSHSDFGDVAPSPEPNFQALNVEPIPINLAPSRSVGRPQQSDHAKSLQQLQSASDAKKASGIKKRSLPSSFYKRPSQDSPAQGAGKTPQQPPQPESLDRRASSSESTFLECVKSYEALGYSRDIVMDALGRTSRRPGPKAELLMELLSKNEEVPDNIEGVWTDQDDVRLRWVDRVQARGSKATEVHRAKAKVQLEWLVDKHTEAKIDLRRRYYEMLPRKKA
ncbi:hypothetical protein E4U15_000696 [Claviceps sp. LM218 group G6]|nr:hypothetical protein E4U15_000696 [Claviceps sp. LM218 group G6]